MPNIATMTATTTDIARNASDHNGDRAASARLECLRNAITLAISDQIATMNVNRNPAHSSTLCRGPRCDRVETALYGHYALLSIPSNVKAPFLVVDGRINLPGTWGRCSAA